MSALTDLMVVGQPKLPSSHFDAANGYQSDFNDPNLIQSGGLRESRQGQLRPGFYAQGINVGWGESAWGPNAINSELQHYINQFDPNPSGYNPYFVRGGNLILESRPTTAAEKLQYFIKGYYLAPDGRFAEQGWFTAANGFPSGPPAGWQPVNEGWSAPSTIGGGGVMRFDKYPAEYLAAMVSMYGLYAQSFGEVEFKVRYDVGGQGMTETDIRNVQALFAAVWELEDIPFGMDMNGDPLDNGQTEMPAASNADGIIEESDIGEGFSEDNNIVHQTIHWHDGPNKLQDAEGIVTAFNVDEALHVMGSHRIADPAGGGKVGFYIDGVYSRVLDMPGSWRDQMVKYQPDPAATYKPLLDGGGSGIVTGVQVNEDGSPRYRKFTPIANMARDSKLVRDAVRNFGPAANVPPYKDVAEVEIEYIRCSPQKTDNPDRWGVSRKGVLVRTDGAVGGGGTASFDDSFRFRIAANPRQYVGGSTEIIATPLANPHGYPYRFEFEVDAALVPAGVTVDLVITSGNSASVTVDAAIEVADLIIVRAVQNGEPA